MQPGSRAASSILYCAAGVIISTSATAESWDSPRLLYADHERKSAELEEYGTATMLLLNGAAVMALGLKQDGPGAQQFAATWVVSQGITAAGKILTNRERPNASDRRSLPSGHASASFAPAAFLQYRYGARYGVPAFIAASFVAYSRVEDRRHHLTDVLVGSAIGVLTARYFTVRTGGTSAQIIPLFDHKQVGLEVALNF